MSRQDRIQSMQPFEYYYWGEVSDKQVRKWHKHDANRRLRRQAKQQIQISHKKEP